MRLRLWDGARGPSRRQFLERVAGGAAGLLVGGTADAHACDVPVTGAPWPSVEGWEHRTIAHFLNTIVPGDDGQPLFAGDPHALDSGGDVTAGAWSACALDVFYDPFYGVGRGSRQLATALDLTTRLLGHGRLFHRATQTQQLEVVDALARTPARADIRRAAALATAACLGAAVNPSVTLAIGWPGPNGGFYDAGRHPAGRWRQPERMTADGNLP
jgi:hypothetical protein